MRSLRCNPLSLDEGDDLDGSNQRRRRDASEFQKNMKGWVGVWALPSPSLSISIVTKSIILFFAFQTNIYFVHPKFISLSP